MKLRSASLALLLIAVVLAGCTDSNGADRDGDGLENSDEISGWFITVETMEGRFTRHVTSDPDLADTDGDGVTDVFEFGLGLDPRSADTDGDGLTDCQEVRHTVQAECEDPEWDGETDGGYRTAGHLADSDASSSRYVNARLDEFGYRARTDLGQVARGDGIPDGEEIGGFGVVLPNGRTRFVMTDPLRVDTDGDGLEDAEERFLFGTDPTVADTDGDGCDDGFDLMPGMHEFYRVDLREFTWMEEGRSGSIDIVFILSLVDQGFSAPDNETMGVRHGETVDLSQVVTPSLRPPQCSYRALEPWVRVDIQVAEFEDGAFAGAVDVQSKTVPDGKFSLWWNVQDSTYRWNMTAKDTVPEATALAWEGADGRISFDLSVSGPP